MKTKMLLPLCCLLLLATGCGYLEQDISTLPPEPLAQEAEPQVMTVPYHEHALYNFQLGRGYLAQGRYELAKERFLLALASAGNDALRRDAVAELEIVDRLIRSQR